MRNTADIYMPSENIQQRNMPFVMAYKPVEMLFFPIFFSLCLYSADIWLLLNLPFGETTLSMFLRSFLVGVLAAPIIGFWAIRRHGAFIISADKKGLYYKQLEDQQKCVFIGWESIHDLSIKESNKKTLIIETTFNKFKKHSLPAPCNGDIYFLEPGTICLEFNTSFAYKNENILNNLNDLRRRYYIKKFN